MPRGFLKTENLTRDTLLRIASLGLMTIVASTSPYFLHTIVRAYFKDSPAKARMRARKLRELERRKLIEFKELDNGTVRILLSHKGENLIRQYNIDSMRVKKPDTWDKFWRVLIYDIPVTKKKAAEAFR